MLASPIVHISCSENVELVEPATIKVPLTLCEDKKGLATVLSADHVRILHLTTKGRSPEWTEITDQLETKPVVTNGIVTFQVKHFCWWVNIYFLRVSIDVFVLLFLDCKTQFKQSTNASIVRILLYVHCTSFLALGMLLHYCSTCFSNLNNQVSTRATCSCFGLRKLSSRIGYFRVAFDLFTKKD